MSGATNDGADRRRHRRFQVDVPGTVKVAGRTYPVTVSDLSSGGALVYLKEPFVGIPAPDVILSIEDFGAIPATIVRTGKGFWGLRFANPQEYRYRLIGWLQQEVKT